MPTTFTSLRVSGTATIATLVATAVTLTTVAITTLTSTTANITTANVQTLSGTTILATEVGDVIEGTTISGSTIRNTAGTISIDGTDLESNLTISGATVRAITGFTGATLMISDTSGSGAINVYGPDGGGTCFFDTDAAGWTICSYLNGVQACSIAAAGVCPRF